MVFVFIFNARGNKRFNSCKWFNLHDSKANSASTHSSNGYSLDLHPSKCFSWKGEQHRVQKMCNLTAFICTQLHLFDFAHESVRHMCERESRWTIPYNCASRDQCNLWVASQEKFDVKLLWVHVSVWLQRTINAIIIIA